MSEIKTGNKTVNAAIMNAHPNVCKERRDLPNVENQNQ